MKNLLRTLALTLAAGFIAGSLFGQDVSRSLAPSGAIAWTECLGGHVKTYIDVEVIGTDSLQEILVHEAKHKEQAERTAPACPHYEKPWQLLADEVEAYCTSRPLREQRGYIEIEVDVNYMARLLNQFKGVMPRRDIISAYQNGCPSHHLFRWMNP